MAGIAGNPSIVSSGLMLYLDAANKKSYRGSGNTWFDLTTNRRNATLFNTPSFSNVNGGTLSFSDTSFQYATIPNIGSLTNFSIESWARTNKSLTGKVTTIVTNQYDLVSNLNYSLGTNNAAASYNMTFGFFNGAWRNVTGFDMTINTWYHMIGTYNGSSVILYVNGVAGTPLSYVGTATSGGEIRIARRWDDVANNAAYFFSGDIPVVKIYNRALSASEVLQNFNATRNRFGI
jgi:hypothetical protein